MHAARQTYRRADVLWPGNRAKHGRRALSAARWCTIRRALSHDAVFLGRERTFDEHVRFPWPQRCTPLGKLTAASMCCGPRRVSKHGKTHALVLGNVHLRAWSDTGRDNKCLWLEENDGL